jgi:transcriptional regulator with XRE-family HTH domain
MKRLTQSQMLELLKKRKGDRPASKLAEELGISASYLCEIFKGTREPGPAVLGKIGLERVVLYREVNQ